MKLGGPERLVAWAAGVALLALMATLGRPPDFDEANFLTLARGAVLDPWRPHDIEINWQGITEPAFAVLSNPPGIAWWLSPTLSLPTWVQRAWMLPWLALAGWGALMLGRRFAPGDPRGAALLLASPVVLLSSTALLPDAPLYALTLAGLGGFIHRSDEGRNPIAFALLLGLTTWFRYSGLALLPLLPLYAFLNRRPLLPSLAGAIPIAALILHDVSAYGSVHLLAMGKFQSVSNSPLDWQHKAAAALAMLGAVAAVPIFPWRSASFVGAGLGALAGSPWGPLAAGCSALGGATLGATLAQAPRGEQPAAASPPADRIFLAVWAATGFLFLLSLRFTATRYWLPFLPALVLALPAGGRSVRLALSLALGLALVADDALHAYADHRLASEAAALGKGRFVGHWGWQHALESAGWTALDEGHGVEAGTLVAVPVEAWPQRAALRCDEVVWEGEAPATAPWLPRGYSSAGRFNLHANWVAGTPPVRTVVPWGFASDPYERARVCKE